MYVSITSGLEDALDKAAVYENRCDEFDQWLGTAEARLKSWEPLSIASQPLKRQEEEIKVRNGNIIFTIAYLNITRLTCSLIY